MVLEAKSHVWNCKNHFVTYSIKYHYEFSTYNSHHKVLVNMQASNMNERRQRRTDYAKLRPISVFWACTYFGGMYGIKTIRQCFVQSPSCIVSQLEPVGIEDRQLQPLVTTCDNDLTPLLSDQKTATWSGRISWTGCYSRIYSRRLYMCYCI